MPATRPLPPRSRRAAIVAPALFALLIMLVVFAGGLAVAYLEAVSAWTRENDDISSMAKLADDPGAARDGDETMQLSRYLVAKTQLIKHGEGEGEAACIDRLVDRLGVLMGPEPEANPAIQTLCEERRTTGHIVDESPRLVLLRPRFDDNGNHIATEVTIVQTTPRPGFFQAALTPSILIAILAIGLLCGLAAYLQGRRSQRGYDALWEAAALDGLTGCLRRETFQSMLSDAVAEAHGSGRPLSLMIVDVDDLKIVNDRHGHAGGDAAIRIVAGEMARGSSPGTAVGRLGGDEFAALMVGVPLADAVAGAERLRAAIAAARGTGVDADVTTTASIGVAELVAGEDPVDLLARADRALYVAKQAKRGQGGPTPAA